MYLVYYMIAGVAPLVGAWIEISFWSPSLAPPASLLSWERGLKYKAKVCVFPEAESLLSWERGLKYFLKCNRVIFDNVAPLVGAWIEIVYSLDKDWSKKRRSSRGSVD